MMIPVAHAENYRLVHSPTLKLEVFIDDVNNSKPESWCANSILLRITSAQSQNTSVLTDFLPRVGSLLERQCPKVVEIPWIFTDKQGNKIASGSAKKSQKWQPVAELPEATNPADTGIPPAVAVVSPLATQDNIVSFALPQGCQFRTNWNDHADDSTIFIPSTDTLHCDSEGFLNGRGTVVIPLEGGNQTHNVVFYQGYPLLNIDTGSFPLRVVSANAQRLVLGSSNSFLVLPFDPQLHAWVFQGEVIIEMARELAADQVEVSQEVTRARDTWRPLLTQSGISLRYRLVETLAAERVDPASGSYLSVNEAFN
ncbi:type VI secretion system-associated protein [Serratia sp. Ag1]|uniref:type VI secretion system-associated protein n=1 Tax=unclassified Serratia (in: enterobacteria) TaxID=2647522 RepID=UPI0035102D54